MDSTKESSHSQGAIANTITASTTAASIATTTAAAGQQQQEQRDAEAEHEIGYI